MEVIFVIVYGKVHQESPRFTDMLLNVKILQDTKSNLPEEIKNSTRNCVIMTIF